MSYISPVTRPPAPVLLPLPQDPDFDVEISYLDAIITDPDNRLRLVKAVLANCSCGRQWLWRKGGVYRYTKANWRRTVYVHVSSLRHADALARKVSHAF